jgi:hypothetical protein
MLKRDITYTDFFTEETVTEPFYFNLTEAELIEFEVEYEGGFQKVIQNVVAAQDVKELIAQFKKIILLAYGEKQGNQFVKSADVRNQFAASPAYSALFMELATDADAASTFVNGIIPKVVNKDQDKPAGPPPGAKTSLSAPTTPAIAPPPGAAIPS